MQYCNYDRYDQKNKKNNNLLIVNHNVKDHTVDGGVRAWSIVAVSFCLSIIEVGGALFGYQKNKIWFF